ncbi:ABC transporter ATP-binding protein, partial [Rhizobium ruizarguesonis]
TIRRIRHGGCYRRGHGAVKGALEERKKAEKAAEKTKTQQATASGSTKVKLSFKQKFALENLPKEMAKAEAEIAKREKVMADPNLFTRDPAAFNR